MLLRYTRNLTFNTVKRSCLFLPKYDIKYQNYFFLDVSFNFIVKIELFRIIRTNPEPIPLKTDISGSE